MKAYKWVVPKGRPIQHPLDAGVSFDDALITVIAPDRATARAKALEYGNEFGRFVEWIDWIEPVEIDLSEDASRVVAYHGYPAIRATK